MSDINGNEVKHQKFLTIDNLSPAVKHLQYAVRGKIVIRAGEIERELKQVSRSLFKLYNCDTFMSIE